MALAARRYEQLLFHIRLRLPHRRMLMPLPDAIYLRRRYAAAYFLIIMR